MSTRHGLRTHWWWRFLDRLYSGVGIRRCWYCGRATAHAEKDGSVMCNGCWRRM